MTPTQVFNWFCKEQGIMPNITMIYYKIHPKCNIWENGGIKRKYLTYDEYVKSKLMNGSFSELFISIQNDYIFTLGLDKYDEYSKGINLVNLDKKWRYFAKNNIFIDEDCLKVGDVITFKVSDWRRVLLDNQNPYVDEAHRGRVDSIDVGNGIITIWDCNDDKSRTYYSNEFYNKNFNIFDFDLNFYIKRNRRKYYGKNNGK
jgi:hypothetical protein